MFRDSGSGNGNGNGHHQNLTTNEWADNRLDLNSKVAVVTGGGRGIGAATCIALARAGVKVIGVVDVSEEVRTLCNEINEQLGRPALFAFQGDVTDAGFRQRVFLEMKDRFGPVSICVPAAGITRDRLSVRRNPETGANELYPEADFRRVIDIDLTAPIYWALETVKSIADDRAARGLKRWMPTEALEGAVVLIGSVSSLGNKGQISYAAAKAGLEGARGTIAAEAIFHGVRCAIIHPGYTDTAMVRSLGSQFIDNFIVPQTQLRRLIHPDEIADAIVFMIRNSALSGELWVDAGWHPAV